MKNNFERKQASKQEREEEEKVIFERKKN